MGLRADISQAVAEVEEECVAKLSATEAADRAAPNSPFGDCIVFSEEDRLQLRETAKLPEDVKRLEEKVTQLEDRFASKDYGRQLSGPTIESMRNDLRQELRAEM